MLTNVLNRPLNFYINRLGMGADWQGLLSFNNTARFYSALTNIFLNLFIKIIFKNGEIFMNNPFFSNIYFLKAVYSLPVLFSEDEIFKFFRPVRLKYTTRFRSKRNFLARKFLKYINFSNLYFYSVNNSVLVLLYIYIPEPIKRSSYLYNIELINKMKSNPNNTYKNNLKLKLNKIIFYKKIVNFIKNTTLRYLNKI